MDTVKIGSFLAELRKENGMTQEALGEKLGVTNKTVSRWETGTYLPPVEMLEALSDLYGLTINELLSGKRLTAEEYRDMAEANIRETLEAGSFDLKEKIEYFKKKWLREHIAVMVLIGLGILAVYLIGFYLRESLIGSVAVLLLIFAHAWRNNTMMAYVEKHAYDAPEKK